MKLSFQSKSQTFSQDGSVAATLVIMGNTEQGYYPIKLDPNKISLSNTELEELALQKIYEENFPNKAENEKFDKVDAKLAEVDAKLAEVDNLTSKLEKQFQLTSQALNELIGLMGEEGGE